MMAPYLPSLALRIARHCLQNFRKCACLGSSKHGLSPPAAGPIFAKATGDLSCGRSYRFNQRLLVSIAVQPYFGHRDGYRAERRRMAARTRQVAYSWITSRTKRTSTGANWNSQSVSLTVTCAALLTFGPGVPSSLMMPFDNRLSTASPCLMLLS